MTASVSRYLLLALLAIGLLPAVASADNLPAVPVPAADALMAGAHGLAVARWAVEPCGGQVAVTWSHMGAGINARAQWMSIDLHDPSTYSECSITYNLDVAWDWPKLCTVVEHELGHLAGHEHVNDPHDVMSPYYIVPSAECAAGQLAQAPAPVAVAQPPGVATSRNATTSKAAAKRSALAKRAKSKAAARRSAAAKLAKRNAIAKRKAIAKRAKGRSTAVPRTKKSARARAADSRAHAALFGCALVSA